MKNLSLFSTVLAAISAANAYFLVGHSNILVTERLDPIVNPGVVSPHVHTIQGGSNFGSTLSTAQLRKSSCSTVPIKEDKSNYWVPQLYFQWKNGTVSSLTGGMVTYYLFDNQPGKTTAFPDDFRMISGDTTLRTYNASSFAQQAVTFLCLDFQGTSTRYNQLPRGISCPSGIRSQINFPSCWDGKNVDSPDHKSHVSYLSTGPDSGSCTDPKFPVTLPRIFLEFYWDAQDWESHRQDALDPQQPFVFANGDATGYGYHADFFNGWDEGVLQRVVDGCHCNDFGDPTCCSDAGLFTFEKNPAQCTIPSTVSENVLGSFAKLPGNNPITGGVVAQPGSASTGGEGTPASVTLKGGAQPTASAPAASAPAASAPAASAPAASAPAASAPAASAPAVSAPAASAPAASAPAASAPAASAPASSGNGAGSVMATSGNGSSPSNSNSNGSSSSSSGTASTSSSSNSGTSSNSGSTPASSGPGSSNSGSTSTSSSGSGSGSSKTCKSRTSRRGLNNTTTTRSKFRNHKMAVRRLTERGMVH